MRTSLFVILFLLQGIPVPPQQGGNASGMLTDADGKPLSGVRVTAVAVPQTAADAANGSAMGAVTQTDELGRYRLENIPPGRYYIAAGRLDRPTYFPGTLEMREGTVLTVGAGTNMDGIVFRLQDSSQGRAVPGGRGILFQVQFSYILIPLVIQTVGGTPVPLSGPAGNPLIQFADGSGDPPSLFPLQTPFVRVVGPGPLEYRVSVQNLPEGFAVETMQYDGVDVRTEPLKLSQSLWSTGNAAAYGAYFRLSTATPPVPPPIPARLTPVQQVNGSAVAPRLLVSLKRLSSGSSMGVRVSGHLAVPPTSISLSGREGLFFEGGGFEFDNVPEGVHTVLAFGPRPMAASLIVGKADIPDVKLQSVPVLPLQYEVPRPATAIEQLTPGAYVPLTSVRGRIIDATTGKPIEEGSVYLTGSGFGTSREVGANGEFEIGALLQGSYKIEIHPFAHESVSRTIVVDEAGLNLTFESKETSP